LGQHSRALQWHLDKVGIIDRDLETADGSVFRATQEQPVGNQAGALAS
jgi:hypothetical protein